jgi:hypothetical protein
MLLPAPRFKALRWILVSVERRKRTSTENKNKGTGVFECETRPTSPKVESCGSARLSPKLSCMNRKLDFLPKAEIRCSGRGKSGGRVPIIVGRLSDAIFRQKTVGTFSFLLPDSDDCRATFGGLANDGRYPVTLKPRKPLASFRLPTRDPNQWLPLYALCMHPGHGAPSRSYITSLPHAFNSFAWNDIYAFALLVH